MTQAAILGIIITLTATLVVLGSLAIFAGLSRPRRMPDMGFGPADQDVVFIFRGHDLIDCSDPARALLKSLAAPDKATVEHSDYVILLQYLARRFPDVQTRLAGLAQSGPWEMPSHTGDGLVLSARFHKGLMQLRLTDTLDEGALLAIDRLSHDAQQKELKTLRAVVRNLPTLVWQCDAHGNIIWANTAYIQALQGFEQADHALAWPLPDLFAQTETLSENRLAFEKQGQTHWFSHNQLEEGAYVTHFATPIDAAVQSEAARRETLQILTRTFACLPIGLALFDAERRLQVFNPALVDLTGLEPLFLAARPSFEQVLYALREIRMLPEPKDFNSWRNDILDMEKAAENGDYAEEWCLDDGRTYLVNGRPQPNGAIALFIQDVTTEASLARSFRAGIETAHKVLDHLQQGIIVFGLGGQALLANAQYVQLWKTDPCTDLADKGLPQALRHWSDNSTPTAFWAQLAEFLSTQIDRSPVTGTITLQSGTSVNVTGNWLSGGNIMLSFQYAEKAAGRDQREQDLQIDLLNRPEPILRFPEGEPRHLSSERPHIPDAPRKSRSARHVGTRVRA